MTATVAEKKDIGRMTALLEERDRLYETTEEMDVTVVEMEETIAKETDAMDATEMDATETDATEVTEMDMTGTDTLTIHLVTSNDLRGLPP